MFLKNLFYLFSIISFLSFFTSSFSQTSEQEQEVENLTAFAKLYGHVRYFYPGDEAAETDWNKFVIAGVEEIRKTEGDQDQLLETLQNLFLPIAPGIVLGKKDASLSIDSKLLTPNNYKNRKTIFWQHKGMGMEAPNYTYQSIRINRKLAPVTDRNGEMQEFPEELFKAKLKVGETAEVDLGQGLKAIIPLALFGDENHTFPQTDIELLQQHQQKINELTFPYNQGSQLPVRLANIIITWNVFQHFYPYFDLIDLDWEKEFISNLQATYEDQSFVDFRIRLEKMTAKLNDGHIRVSVLGDDTESGTPRFTWEWIEDQLVITKILDPQFTQVHLGETIIEIEGQKPESYFEEINSRISSSTEGWKKYRAQILSLQGEYMGNFSLKVKGLDGVVREEIVKRDMRLKDFFERFKDVKITKEIKPGIWYLNLDQTPWSVIDTLLPELTKAKAIICDLRGYPNGNHQLINHLLEKKDNSSTWMQIPQILYPDFQSVRWLKLGWNLKPEKPHLTAPVYFLTDGRAISYAESYMSFIKHYDLATIIGQPTAGTNGNVNYIILPGKYRITWTGMRVRKHDGSELYGTGIQPDIFVERTIEGVIQQRDEFLERALMEIEKK